MDIGQYPSSKALLVDHMKVESAKLARTRAALKVWLGCIAAASELEDPSTGIVGLPKTWGWYLLSGCQCPPKFKADKKLTWAKIL